ncbi:hypothetical protein [Melissospora conviva]|uniref:hypothetical protein n=1 Tax=Melissospora conviva TaxID=3388432 RepID=UPI003B815110
MQPAGDVDERFVDRSERLCCFAGEILVRCPRCDGQASIVSDPADKGHRHLWVRRRLVCRRCGRTAAWEAPRIPGSAGRNLPRFSGPRDPYFGLSLWLSIDCRGRVLWAYNAEHLELLESYVSAGLRERGRGARSMSMVERLPKWIKDARNRTEVVRAIRRMKTSLS